MSEEQLFFIVLLLLYLAEGLHLIPQKSIVFKSHFGSSYRWRFPANIIGSINAGVLFSNPLPPFGSYFVISPWPVSLSPHGILSHTPATSNAILQSERNGRLQGLDDIDTVCTKSKLVSVNGVDFVRCASDSEAGDLAEFLRTLVSLPFPEREPYLESFLRTQFDVQEIESKLGKFKEETLFLRIICHLQFLFMFVVFPVWAFHFGFAYVMLPFLVGIIVISLLIGFMFYMTHASLFGSEKGGRLRKTLAMAVYPPAGIRSVEYLSLGYLRSFNMVAVASVLCRNDDFRKLALQILRESRYLIPAQPSDLREEALETDAWWRSKIERALTKFMKQSGVSTDLISEKCRQAEDLSVSFCPRCHCEYLLPEGFCPDCENVELLPITKDDHSP